MKRVGLFDRFFEWEMFINLLGGSIQSRHQGIQIWLLKGGPMGHKGGFLGYFREGLQGRGGSRGKEERRDKRR